MAHQIKDGTGTGNLLKVGSDNRLQARAVVEQEVIHAAESGNAFNLNTGLISITGDATLCYFKNTSNDQFVITGIALGSFEGITHSDDPYITLVRNPTGGDLISDATTSGVMNQNRNFGSTKALSGVFYKGKVGGTVTGGDDIAILQATAGSRSFYAIDFILTKNNSIGIKLNANVSSGSANWYCALIGYYKDGEDIG